MDNSNTCAFGKHVTSVFSDLFFFVRLGRKTERVWLEGHIKQPSALLPFGVITVTREYYYLYNERMARLISS